MSWKKFVEEHEKIKSEFYHEITQGFRWDTSHSRFAARLSNARKQYDFSCDAISLEYQTEIRRLEDSRYD